MVNGFLKYLFPLVALLMRRSTIKCSNERVNSKLLEGLIILDMLCEVKDGGTGSGKCILLD